MISKLSEEEVAEQINHLLSQKPLPKTSERKQKENRRSVTPEELGDLYDTSENPKGHDDEEKQKWSREPVDDLLLTEIRVCFLPNLANFRFSPSQSSIAYLICN